LLLPQFREIGSRTEFEQPRTLTSRYRKGPFEAALGLCPRAPIRQTSENRCHAEPHREVLHYLKAIQMVKGLA
jgi:hypothetical protein